MEQKAKLAAIDLALHCCGACACHIATASQHMSQHIDHRACTQAQMLLKVRCAHDQA
jgi:hypothetical protein